MDFGSVASGLTRGLSNILFQKRQVDQQKEHDRESQQFQVKLGLLQQGLQQGQDPNVLIPALGIDLHFGEKPQKGQIDHNALLGHLLGPLAPKPKSDTSAPAQAGSIMPDLTTPSAPTASSSRIPFLSPEEQAQQKRGIESADMEASVAARRKIAENIGLKGEQAVRFALTGQMPVEKTFTPGAVGKAIPTAELPADAVDPKGQPIDKTTGTFWQPFRTATGDVVYIPGAAGTTSKVRLPTGKVREFLDTALAAKGILSADDATPDQIQEVLPEVAAQAKKAAKSGEELQASLLALRGLQEDALRNRQNNLPTGDDLQQNARSITVNGKTYSFVNKGEYAGADAQNAATKAGLKTGVLVVTPNEAAQLDAATATLKNLDAFYQQIKDKLPPDAAGRPLQGLSNKMAQIFQTDDELGAFVSWDLEVVPMLRSLLVNNRITNTEFNKAINARPKIGDTVGVATQKMKNLETIISNSVSPILERGKKAAGDTKPKPAPTANQRLKARQYLLDHQQLATDANINALLAKPGIDAVLSAGH